MKRHLVLTAVAILSLTGCSTTNISELTKALKDDPAIVSVNIGTVYGTIKFIRVGSQTNEVTVMPDGTVTTKHR